MNITISQFDLTDFYRMLYSTPEEYTFFSNFLVPFNKIDHSLEYKMYLNKFTII